MQRIIDIVKDKKVFLACHWDADGVTSGALIYHSIKDHVSDITTLSKGDEFQIQEKDVPEDAQIVICIDIQPALDIDPLKVILIDHHPNDNTELFRLSIYDAEKQSCSLLIWEELLKETDNPYFIALILLGFFGDGGKHNNIPPELYVRAKEHFPYLMEERCYKGNRYVNLQRFVSSLNVGKRLFWSGDIGLAMLKDLDKIDPFVNATHPIAQQINMYKTQLNELYKQDVKLQDLGNIDMIEISCEQNIQGVLCARHMHDKPILVLNKLNGKVMGSMRVPDNVFFDAGEFLNTFKLDSYLGGGHDKAGGFTIDAEHLPVFIEQLKEKATQ